MMMLMMMMMMMMMNYHRTRAVFVGRGLGRLKRKIMHIRRSWCFVVV